MLYGMQQDAACGRTNQMHGFHSFAPAKSRCATAAPRDQ
ncbi:hypothetical protein CAter10_3831 [Collimonas arenae]|nr:hypothetical protein CAter10_3831 [Collimonas arenae]